MARAQALAAARLPQVQTCPCKQSPCATHIPAHKQSAHSCFACMADKGLSRLPTGLQAHQHGRKPSDSNGTSHSASSGFSQTNPGILAQEDMHSCSRQTVSSSFRIWFSHSNVKGDGGLPGRYLHPQILVFLPPEQTKPTSLDGGVSGLGETLSKLAYVETRKSQFCRPRSL